jgi:ABC-type phosphate transport system substrate-binding protein
MRNFRRPFIALALAVTLAAWNISAQQSKEVTVAVVVNPANPVNAISTADLRKIYSGDKVSWGVNLPVIPFVRSAPAHERDVMLKAVMKMTDAQYQGYWIKKVYSDQSVHEPIALTSTATQLDAVRSQTGGIAFINAQEVRPGVKVIKIDDLLPGAPGYSLK